MEEVDEAGPGSGSGSSAAPKLFMVLLMGEDDVAPTSYRLVGNATGLLDCQWTALLACFNQLDSALCSVAKMDGSVARWNGTDNGPS